MAAPSKRSRLERIVDKIILFMFSLLFSFCICGSVYFSWWTQNRMPLNWYLMPSTPVDNQYNPSRPAFVGFASFITSFILYGYLIPISLYVSMELVKITQIVFIARDLDMYHAETDTPALARTSNLNEELGMVNTILSDKTGTLTRNVMEFFRCSIAGVSYGAGFTEVDRANAKRRGQVLPQTDSDPEALRWRERFFNFYDSRIMGSAWTHADDPETVEMFFRLLAVCHTVVPDGPQTPEGIKYEAESPDEAALVVAAKVFGFFFFKRTNTTVTVRECGPHTGGVPRDCEYELLNILEFNSTRKRMSIIVRDPSNRLVMFCKGADTVIYERLDPAWPPNERMKSVTQEHMSEYGNAGLRTLCLSYTELDPAFYKQWQAKWVEAKTSLQGRDEKVAEVSEEVEKNLRLLGCTAIEDKLQEGVPQCIEQLAMAGIRIWVLTGDKMETAINIGYACSLLTDEMARYTISLEMSERRKEVEALDAHNKDQIDRVMNEIIAAQLTSTEQKMRDAKPGTQHALVIDGLALSAALSKILRAQFLRIGLQCQAVICCRVSPLQKAQVTELVRNHGDTTLAIGDGANDVGMIQKAHIGVGISGQEGMQAVMSADFAIAQFRFLVPLLLIHGRYSYKRISRMVLFFFYKNMLFGVTIFMFNAMNVFSGQFVYNDFYMTLYNVVFTSLTPLAVGMFDRDVDKYLGLRFPGLYRQGQRNEFFGPRAILTWLASSLYQCGIVYFFIIYGCRSTEVDRASGHPYTMWQTGVLMFSVIMLTVHMQVTQVTEQWTWIHHLCIWLSQIVWWAYLLAYGAFPYNFSTDLYRLFTGIVAQTPQYWLYLLLVPAACQLPDFFLRMVQKSAFPYDHQIVQEEQLRLQRAHIQVSNTGQVPSTQLSSGLDEIFQSPQQHPGNKGVVLPTNPNSRFYSLFSGKSQEQAGRNPVVDKLDQELTVNPHRGMPSPVPPHPAGSPRKTVLLPPANGYPAPMPAPGSSAPAS